MPETTEIHLEVGESKFEGSCRSWCSAILPPMTDDPHLGGRRYHGVMISSTFADLPAHRACAMEAIESHGMHAVAQEQDGALPTGTVVSSSLRKVRESSAYLVIVGRRYGQVPESAELNPDGRSLTELEYREARRLGRPILALLMSDEHAVKPAAYERDPDKARKLERFREDVMRAGKESPLYRVYAQFDDEAHFAVQVHRSAAALRRLLDQQDEPANPPYAQAKAGSLSGVPPLPQGYVIRDELSDLLELIVRSGPGLVDDPALAPIGLHGQGGIGKTVLAAAAARNETVRRAFPDGVYWVTLGESSDIVSAQMNLFRRVDPTAPLPYTAIELDQQIRMMLAGQRALVIVDDVWSDAAAQAFRIVGKLGRLIYTSRDRQVLGAVAAEPFAVDTLSSEGARALAVAVLDDTHGRVRSVSRQESSEATSPLPRAADEAISRVGRIALAVSLLAAAVKAGRSWAQVADDLDSVPDIFGDHPYANGFKAMQIGFEMLGSELADALLSLTIFSRDQRIPVAPIARYWNNSRAYSPDRTYSVLDRLSSANLISFDKRSVTFHDLQHEFITLHAPALAVLHGRLLDAYRLLLGASRTWSELPIDEPYIWDHVVHHLRNAGARRELAMPVTDPAFLAHRIASAGLLAAEDDLANAAQSLPEQRAIAWWRGWLPRHADVLTIPRTATDATERHHALAPSLFAWLSADSSRPANIEVRRVRSLCTTPLLMVKWGLRPRPAGQLRSLPGRTDGTFSVEWSPDSARLAVTSNFKGGPVQVWDPDRGDVTSIVGTAGAFVAEWSPDSNFLAIGDSQRAAQIWTTATGHVECLAETDHAFSLAWSPDSTNLAISGWGATGVWVWDRDSGATTTLPLATEADRLAWSPNGQHLAIANQRDKEEVLVWNITSRRINRLLSVHGETWKLLWSPNGKHLACAGSRSGTVSVWTPNGQHPVSLGVEGAYQLAWSPDSRLLAASGLRSAWVWVWDSTSGHITTVPDGRGSGVLVWSPDSTHLAMSGRAGVTVWTPCSGGTMLVSGTRSADVVAWSPNGTFLVATTRKYAAKEVRVWSPANHQTNTVPGSYGANELAWSPDGNFLAVTTAGYGPAEVRVWHPDSGHTATLPDTHAADMLCWSPDSRRIATATRYRQSAILTWDSSVFRDSLHSVVVTARAWSPDRSYLATSIRSSEGGVRVWSRVDERSLSLPDTRGAELLAWSPDSSQLAVAGPGVNDVQVWNLGSLRTIGLPNSGSARKLEWSPDSSHLAIALNVEGTAVLVWNEAIGQTTTLPDAPKMDRLSWVDDYSSYALAWTKLAWSPDSLFLALASSYDDRAVLVWSRADNGNMSLSDTSNASSLDWSPDSKYLAVSGFDSGPHPELVRVWERSSRTVVVIRGPRNSSVLRWSPNSRYLAITDVTDKDHLWLWEPVGNRIDTLPCGNTVNHLAWSPDSSRLAGGGVPDGPVSVWDCVTKHRSEVHGTCDSFILAWSADSSHLACASLPEHQVGTIVWKAVSGRSSVVTRHAWGLGGALVCR